jgi:hypothetical protein
MRDTRDGKGLEYEWFCALRKQRTERNYRDERAWLVSRSAG